MINHNIKLNRILINKFRNFENVEIKFGGDNYYVIAGKNGLGKTGILEAINIALSDNSSKFNNINETDFYSDDEIEFEIEFNNFFFFKFEDAGYERLIPCKSFKKTISRRQTKERNSLFSPPYEIKYEYFLQDYSPSKTDFDELKSFIQANIKSNLYLVRRLKVQEDGSLLYMKESENFSSESDWSNGSNPDIRYGIDKLPKVLFPKVFYFDKDRTRELLDQYNTTISRVITELNWRIKREILKLDDLKKESLKSKYTDLHKEIKGLDKHKTELIDPVMDVVRDKLGISIIDQGLDFYFMDLFNPYKGSLLGHKTAQDQIVPVMKYGSGISSLISLTFLMEFAKQAKECILVLIDEPEIHLHPELSKKLKTILLESEFQSILSTHSHLFLDKKKCKNNICLDLDRNGEIYVRYCNQIDLADVQFKLLGSSLDDLYIPQRILLVEGKYDKLVLSECLAKMGLGDIALQILDCEGYTDIPNKADRYKKALDSIKDGTEKYKSFVKQDMTILVDGDVETTVVDRWKTTYQIEAENVNHLPQENKCLEYVCPESLIKECVVDTVLDDGTNLSDKDKTEIIKIIMSDEDKKTGYTQISNRVSKSRLNTFIANHINEAILRSDEAADLFTIIKWIASRNERVLE